MRTLCIVMILITVVFLPIGVSADRDNVIRIVGDENYPPYEFVDKNGQYKGFNVDIMHAIAENMGLAIEIKPMSWESALEALGSKQADVIQGLTRSYAREQKFNFSKALIKNSQVIFVRSDQDNISELQNLAGLKVAFQSCDISEEYIKKIPGVRTQLYSNQEQAMQALLDGEVDAFIGNRLTGQYLLQNMKQFNKIKIVGEALCTTDYSAAALEDNKKVLALLNTGLDNIKKNGVYDQIYNKWFGEIVDNGIFWKRAAVFFSSILIFILGIIPIVFYWNVSLKKVVVLKTGELAAANNALQTNHQKLEQSYRFRGKIIETILDGIITFNNKGEVLGANQAAKRLLHIEKEDGITIEDIRQEHPIIYHGYQQAAKGRIWRMVFEWETGQGILNIDCNIYPIKGPEDLMEGVIIVLHDFTESKLLSEAMEYDKLKTEFFANISHEFRTPLSVIHAAVQLLKLNGEGSDPKSIKGAIDKSAMTIRQNINRLTRLIDNIIDITKVDTGFIQLQLRNYNIVSIVEEVTLSVASLMENKGITIEFDTDVEEKIIACDIDKIERVMLNILSNSVKFTPNGGNIYVNVKDGTEFVTISIRDTGIGIPKDKLELVFERFRQVDKSITRNHEGSGIGLSLVKSLVELHGGSVKVESSLGQGSEFLITLPVQKEDNEEVISTEAYNASKTEVEFSDIYL